MMNEAFTYPGTGVSLLSFVGCLAGVVCTLITVSFLDELQVAFIFFGITLTCG